MAPVQYIDHGLAPPPSHGVTIGGVLLQPTSRGAVTLASKDPFAKPLMDANYLAADGEVAPLVHGIKLARTIAEQPALKDVITGEAGPGPAATTDADLEAYIREVSFTLYHPVGTCAMGPDPTAGAVVDAHLRVHGIDGLRVIDASVMPTITRGNTNAPTIMIAERAVAFIRGDAAARRRPTTG
jgi:choline dehydrogenase-like flavoprotein